MTALLGALPVVCILLGGFLVGRGGRLAGSASLSAGLASIFWLAVHRRTGASGTFDGDPFSLFFGGLILVELAGAWWIGNEKEPSRRFFMAAALILAVSSRNLLWIYAGFGAFSLLTGRHRASSTPALAGLVLVAAFGGGTDLAVLAPTSVVKLGVGLFSVGMIVPWIAACRVTGFGALGSGVALVAFWIRLVSWAPELVSVWEPLGWMLAAAAITIGGLGAALAGRTPGFLSWLSISQVGFAILGVSGGAPALAYVLLHTAAATLAILLLTYVHDGETSRSTPASWILTLSLASVPPLPGFVTKLPLLSALSPASLVLSLVGTALVGIGCARLLARTTFPEPTTARLATGAAVVFALALGVFPDALFHWAALAAAGLF